MDGLELIAAALGLVNVALVVRRSVWNFPFGIAMVLLYAIVFFRVRLYGDAALQLFFLVAQIYGWWNWTRAIGRAGEIAVRWSDRHMILYAFLSTAGLTLLLGTFLARYTDAAAPYLDATITVGSMTAQLLLSTRRIESWLYWIAVDCLSIGVYLARGLSVTAGLYAVFLVLAVAGLVGWLRRGPVAGVTA